MFFQLTLPQVPPLPSGLIMDLGRGTAWAELLTRRESASPYIPHFHCGRQMWLRMKAVPFRC